MSKNEHFKIIGHRGAAGLAVENTMESFLKAINLGVDCIEIDVWKTTDNEIIVFHDAYLDRLTNSTGFVNELDYKTIQTIKLGNGEKIPTLREVINLVKGTGIQLLVEVKDENALGQTVDILKEQLPVSEFIVGSFFHEGIKELKERSPQVQTSIMFESVPVKLEEYLKVVNADYVTVSIESFNNYLVDIVKSQNRKLVFYTINIKAEIELAVRASPYGIVTNFPNLFRSAGTTRQSG